MFRRDVKMGKEHRKVKSFDSVNFGMFVMVIEN
jgi:hypothetical protein